MADLGAKGYFGKGFATLDYQPAEDVFLQGKSAMFYMGSWAVGDYNDPAKNKIGGPDNVGYFAFPTVAGGSGSIDQLPMNAGDPIMVSAKKYKGNPGLADWLKFLAENYGDRALSLKGAISGFPATSSPANPAVNHHAGHHADQGDQGAAGLVRVADVGQGSGRRAEERGRPGQRQCLSEQLHVYGAERAQRLTRPEPDGRTGPSGSVPAPARSPHESPRGGEEGTHGEVAARLAGDQPVRRPGLGRLHR